MKYKPSKRSQVTSTAQQFTEIANKLVSQGKQVFRLHVGQPSTSAPKGSINAVKKMIETDVCGYTSSLGLMALREKIARHYKDRYDLCIDPHRVIVTTGASCSFIIACLASFDPGEKIMIPYPVYPAYLNILEQVEVETIGISTSLENRFQPTIEDLENIKDKVQGLLVVSPGNPSGSTLTPDELKNIIAYSNDRGFRLFSDEIYHGIEYKDSQADTALRYSDEVIVLNSFSKYYSMPGWRIGWMVVPDNMVKQISSLIRSLYISAPSPSQYAALAALDCQEELNQHVIHYKENRDILLHEMPKVGFDKFVIPEGAFYFYAHVKHLHKDAHAFCEKMLLETGVAAMPGNDFDPVFGHHYVRFSYAGSTEDIKGAMAVLKKWRNKK